MQTEPVPGLIVDRQSVKPSAWTTLRAWPRRRWAAALGLTIATFAFAGLSTAMIPNPIFGRTVPTTSWAWPVLAVSSVLAGLLGATYVRAPGVGRPESRFGIVGGLLSYFAVGCPVCNKIVLLALGYSGALQWFAPAQPWLAAAGVVLLGDALIRRLQNEGSCAVLPG